GCATLRRKARSARCCLTISGKCAANRDQLTCERCCGFSVCMATSRKRWAGFVLRSTRSGSSSLEDWLALRDRISLLTCGSRLEPPPEPAEVLASAAELWGSIVLEGMRMDEVGVMPGFHGFKEAKLWATQD